MTKVTFRPYRSTDYQVCIDVFDANCPEFFAPNERQEYEVFLNRVPVGYEVCELDGQTLGAFGLFDESQDVKAINWILLAPQAQGIGVGSKIMQRVVLLSRTSDTRLVTIATSPKAAPFFAQFGAVAISSIADGWGPGMDRIDMELSI